MIGEYNKIIEFIKDLPDKKDKKIGKVWGYYSKADYWRKNWNQDMYFDYALGIDKDTIQNKMGKIIIVFFQEKGYEFENYDQLIPAFKRNQRAAKELIGFKLDKIREVCHYLRQKANYKWTLETVNKFILEDLNELEGDKPIITLKDGEKIYDTKRLAKLEKQGRVYYQKDKWYESN